MIFMTQIEIYEILKLVHVQSIIDETEFYFSKATDKLKEWKKLEVDDELREKLIALSDDYNQFLEIAETEPQIEAIKDILLEIISYCDHKAREKNIRNKYDDKRVLANASVRMGNWFSGLMRLKFKTSEINGQSIINAFNYLLDPVNNSTILSENHRRQVIQNLVGKKYEANRFIEDLKQYFKQFNLSVRNESNYTYLLSSIIYNAKSKWLLDKKVSSENLEEVNYWIFQSNPKVYNLEKALKGGHVKSWKVTAHKSQIKVGDKVIIWQIGNDSGCYSLAEVISDVHPFEEEQYETFYYKSQNNEAIQDRVKLKIEHYLNDNPILWNEIKDDVAFKNLNVGNQGTNFTATKEQFETLLGLIETGLSFEAIKKKFEPDVFGNFITTIRKINDALGIRENDERVVYSLRRNRFSYMVGQRYCLNIYTNDDEGIYRAISIDPISEKHDNFDGKPPQPFYNYTNNFSEIESNIKLIIDAVQAELKRTNKSGYRKYNNPEFEKYVFERNTTSMKPINKILYGPPGTGKTFTLKTKYFPKYTTSETSINQEQYFDSVVRELTWWQVLTLALIEDGTSRVNDLFNNRWVAKKASLSESKNVRATLWGTLQMHTIENSHTVSYTQRQAPLIFDKLEDKTWQLIESEARENCQDLYELLEEVNNFKPNPDKEIKRYVFVTFHQAFGYEDFIEGIKPIMSDDESVTDLAYQIEEGIFKQICSRAETDPENRYAIFIDEINRGNVSAIFGELFTLIENDKRIGMENGFKVKLPYSKKEFGVPANLDIYGTMNTADRSVEALDTALRRRFSFTEMPPVYDIDNENATLTYQYADSTGAEILKTINRRIEKLLDRDHLIGHSYFLMPRNSEVEKKLIDSFYRNIIPLLQEYFYGDYAKIGAVLGSGFVLKNENEEVTFGDGFDSEDFGDKDVYHIIDYRVANNPLNTKNLTFEDAIRKMMNKTKANTVEQGA